MKSDILIVFGHTVLFDLCGKVEVIVVDMIALGMLSDGDVIPFLICDGFR